MRRPEDQKLRILWFSGGLSIAPSALARTLELDPLQDFGGQTGPYRWLSELAVPRPGQMGRQQ